MDFNDTFLSLDHVKTCFPNHEVVVAIEEDIVSLVKPPFRLTFQELEKDDEEEEEEEKKVEKGKGKKKGGKKKRRSTTAKKGEGEPKEKAAKMEEGADANKEEGEILEEDEKREEEENLEVNLPLTRAAHKPKPKLIVEPYVVPNRGPYNFLVPKKNSVPFTPTQVWVCLKTMRTIRTTTIYSTS